MLKGEGEWSRAQGNQSRALSNSGGRKGRERCRGCRLTSHKEATSMYGRLEPMQDQPERKNLFLDKWDFVCFVH